jgi:hypothetical protein
MKLAALNLVQVDLYNHGTKHSYHSKSNLKNHRSIHIFLSMSIKNLENNSNKYGPLIDNLKANWMVCSHKKNNSKLFYAYLNKN